MGEVLARFVIAIRAATVFVGRPVYRALRWWGRVRGWDEASGRG